jgi:hypothetical protein
VSAPYRDTLEPLRERARTLAARRDLVRAQVQNVEKELDRVRESLMSVMTPDGESWWHWSAFVGGLAMGALLALIQWY